MQHCFNVFANVSIGATTVGTGQTGPQTFRFGGLTIYWSPQILGRSFSKARNFTASIVTRMQDSASEFSKKFRGVIPRTLTATEGPPPAPNTQPGL